MRLQLLHRLTDVTLALTDRSGICFSPKCHRPSLAITGLQPDGANEPLSVGSSDDLMGTDLESSNTSYSKSIVLGSTDHHDDGPVAEKSQHPSSLLLESFILDYQVVSPTSAASHESTTRAPESPPCSCTQDLIQIIQQLDDDHFRITTLTLGEVVQLRKRLIAQCDKSIRCLACNETGTIHSLVIIICDRLTEMFECTHKRVRRVHHIITQNDKDKSSLETMDSVDLEDELRGQLFCSATGQMAGRAPCNLKLFQSGPQNSFSNEEQLHMIEALLKLQTASFQNLLINLENSGQAVGNTARQSKVNSLITRLDRAARNTSEELQHISRVLSGS
ncbi:hypothetical protein SCUP234_05645 [Seiridium cupressi]